MVPAAIVRLSLSPLIFPCSLPCPLFVGVYFYFYFYRLVVLWDVWVRSEGEGAGWHWLLFPVR